MRHSPSCTQSVLAPRQRSRRPPHGGLNRLSSSHGVFVKAPGHDHVRVWPFAPELLCDSTSCHVHNVYIRTHQCVFMQQKCSPWLTFGPLVSNNKESVRSGITIGTFKKYLGSAEIPSFLMAHCNRTTDYWKPPSISFN
jgi:hypothetical protein